MNRLREPVPLRPQGVPQAGLASASLDDDPTAGLNALLAGHAERDPFFTASALAAFRCEHGLDEVELAAWLGCSQAALHRLALRRRPQTPYEVSQLAASAGVNAARLAKLLGLA